MQAAVWDFEFGMRGVFPFEKGCDLARSAIEKKKFLANIPTPFPLEFSHLVDLFVNKYNNTHLFNTFIMKFP